MIVIGTSRAQTARSFEGLELADRPTSGYYFVVIPPLRVRVVLFQESAGSGFVWVAQCLEHDIAAYGATIDEAKSAFVRTVRSEMVFALESGRQSLAIEPAPGEFH
jgi:hypothetical protein